ncbi:DUF4350 domain-containing protein [Gordonia aurantiaca]|uniref:DUF4350 domain-containing protein n=1 Tax=Gordonia sp. B21 TaxID=3151852 RepID=UPI003262F283
MTATSPAPATPITPSRPTRGTPWWVWVLVTVFGVLAIGVVVVLAGTALTGVGNGPGPGVTHDPDNPRPNGSRALARIIDDHGGEVRIVRGLDELTDAPRPGSGTTVVVSSVDSLNEGTADQLLERVADADRVVLIAPQQVALELLHLPVDLDHTDASYSAVTARCQTEDIDPTDTITGGGTGYRTTESGAQECFTTDATSNVLIMPRTADRPEIVLASGEMFTNGNLTDHDDAGVAVRLVGGSGEVLWYVPFVTDQVRGEDEPSAIPRALGPLIVLAVFAVLALMLWRGRRFGALVTEPLPAVVKAIETTRARGRMYQKARADARAAAALRIHALTSLASYLGLPYDAGRATDLLADPDWELWIAPGDPPDPAVDAIITTVVSVTGRSPDRVRALLAGPLPATATDLMIFTSELTALEKEVRHTP